MKLQGLPNTKRAIECQFALSPSAALRVLRRGLAATTATKDGAINLWYDDSGTLRGTRDVHRQEVESQTFRTQALALKWYKSALKKIQ